MAGRWMMASIQTSFAIMPAAVYWFGGLLLADGSHALSIGDARRVHDPADAAVLPGRLAARRRPRRADLARALRPDLRVPRPAGRHRGEAGRARRSARPRRRRFDHVWFRYGDGAGRSQDVDFAIPAGTTTAIVGETGAGKTTLGYLVVAALRRRAAARVTIDGVDVRDLTFQSLADLVGVVSQETYLFHATVRENLRFAKPDATDEEVEEAARAAQIHDLIASLPDGYETSSASAATASRAARSSGWRSRGRSCATRRSSCSTRRPRRSTRRPSGSSRRRSTGSSEGRTTIAIAHRLSTIRDADQIVVLDQGRVVEIGHARGAAPGRRPLRGARRPRRRARACGFGLLAGGESQCGASCLLRRRIDRKVIGLGLDAGPVHGSADANSSHGRRPGAGPLRRAGSPAARGRRVRGRFPRASRADRRRDPP